MLDQAHVMAFVVTLITAVLAVMLHYESFILFGRVVGKSALSHRRRMLLMVFGLLIVHIVAIWGFGISAWWLVEVNSVGVVAGYKTLSFLDYIFMSAVTYTWGYDSIGSYSFSLWHTGIGGVRSNYLVGVVCISGNAKKLE